MNLVIDIGNSFTKYSVCANNAVIDFERHNSANIQSVQNICTKHPSIDKCILSATGDTPSDLLVFLKATFNHFIDFSQKTPIPYKSEYKTQSTLGLDRIAAAAYASHYYKNKNVLIIDAGTAITYDLITSNSIYRGGNISPGMDIRFKALNNYTSKLPLLKPEITNDKLGKSTKEAIINGVVNGIIYEIEGQISDLEQNYKNLTVLLTGGDAQFFDNKLKKTIFVLQNLVSLGLNTILNYNVETT